MVAVSCYLYAGAMSLYNHSRAIN